MSDTKAYIQYKGSDLCLDIDCPACGRSSHFDGYFAQYLECACGVIYRLSYEVDAEPLLPGETIWTTPLKADNEMSD